jgi:hypothetical protein
MNSTKLLGFAVGFNSSLGGDMGGEEEPQASSISVTSMSVKRYETCV